MSEQGRRPVVDVGEAHDAILGLLASREMESLSADLKRILSELVVSAISRAIAALARQSILMFEATEEAESIIKEGEVDSEATGD